MSFLDDVLGKRQKLADVLADEDYSGIREIVEALYPDRAHFIYELLQNAEDTGATEACFELTVSAIAFEHNGRPFDEDDVWGITNIGKGNKKDQPDMIGRFGIGFKAVFAYTETPYVWSPTFSFMIANLVLPWAIPAKPELGDRTRFEFPFNNPKKPASDAYSEIKAELEALAGIALLFLTHLKSIRWQIGPESSGAILRVSHPGNQGHIEVQKRVGDETTTSSHFLRFIAPVEGLTQKNVAIAFALDFLAKVTGFDPDRPIAEQLRIMTTVGQVAVYFPAAKETSGLRFHLHAPFVPELSRASVKETPVNAPLFGQLAQLAATSLYTIRDLGLLNGEFMGVLPNPDESLPPRYQPIRAAIILEMKHKPLTPTQARSHAPAKHLLQARAPLKELLSDDDLARLYVPSGEPRQWAIAATQRNSYQDRFLAGLMITEWDIPQFVARLRGQGVQQWLETKSMEWHQQMYALLHDYSSGPWAYHEPDRLKELPIVRLSDGRYSTGDKCYFPTDDVHSDPEFPRVDHRVYSSGSNKMQQEKARRLLETIGVREVGEAVQVQSILKQRYSPMAKTPDDATYLKDLNRFMEFVEKDPTQARVFSQYYIFKGKDSFWLHDIFEDKDAEGRWKNPCSPEQVFLDSPYLDTGLSAYYDALDYTPDLQANRWALAEWYSQNQIPNERLARFARAVGAQTRLEPKQVSCEQNPEWEQLWSRSGERVRSEIDEDYTIESLDVLLHRPSIGLSRLVWRTMCELDSKYLKARYQKNERRGPQFADSQLIHCLRNAQWVPQTNGGIDWSCCPARASIELLPEGFQIDRGYIWLKRVGFGENEARQSAAAQQEILAAQALGFRDRNELGEGRWFAKLSPEDRRRIKDEYERKQQIELPEQTSRNPDLRTTRVTEEAAEAPKRKTEERPRSVPVGLEEVKQKAEQYLRQQYTDADDVMICQVCKAALPFKLDDESYYVEKMEFLPELQNRHYQNYLALCPNHAAMFQHANGSSKELKALFLEMEGHELDVVLAQENATIYFTETHVLDLRAVIAVEAGDQIPS